MTQRCKNLIINQIENAYFLGDEVRKKINLGKVKSDTILSFSYHLINVGQNSLHIISVTPDCNCTGYSLSKSVADVGDSINLKLNVDMKNKHKGKFMLNTVVELNTRQRLYHILIEGERI